MKTDKEIHKIFTACPEYVFLLSGIDASGDGTYESVTVKALQREMDGFYRPNDPSEALVVVEVQFQKDEHIYTRLVTEMAMIQDDNQLADITGVIFFYKKQLDPRTKPWVDIVETVYLDQAITELQKQQPNHPLGIVFRPLLDTDEQELEANAKRYYSELRQIDLPRHQKNSLDDVFLHWLIERLGHLTQRQISMILDLPDIKDTTCGREILEEGIERGEARGKVIGETK
ncbi:MAG: DUF2887 domain-containing protein, partial [Verrucomicrobiota bacterium]